MHNALDHSKRKCTVGGKACNVIKNVAKTTLERKAGQKTEEAMGKTIDKVTDLGTYKGDENNEDNQEEKSGDSTSNAIEEENSEFGDTNTFNPNSGSYLTHRHAIHLSFIIFTGTKKCILMSNH